MLLVSMKAPVKNCLNDINRANKSDGLFFLKYKKDLKLALNTNLFNASSILNPIRIKSLARSHSEKAMTIKRNNVMMDRKISVNSLLLISTRSYICTI